MPKKFVVGDVLRYDITPAQGRLWRVDEVNATGWRGTTVFDMDPGPDSQMGKKTRKWSNFEVFSKVDAAYVDGLVGALRNIPVG